MHDTTPATPVHPADPAARTPASSRTRRRVLGLVLLGVVVLGVAVASLIWGTRPIAPAAVWQVLLAPDGGEESLILWGLRVPRTLLGLMVGAALGVAGVLMQGHTRNPLADPGLLGITQGATLAVVTAVVVLGLEDLYAFVWFALAGAAIAAVVVFLLGGIGGGGATPITLVLSGAAVSALLSGITAAVVLRDQRGMETFRFWQVGSIAARDYTISLQVLPFLAVGLLLAVAGASALNVLALGDDVARSLGRNIAATRTLGIAAITLLTGSAVAACGPIAFLGLVVPHIARRMAGPDHRWSMAYGALIGAILLLTADVAGRLLTSDGLEVGVLLALIGAPVFVVLVRRRRVMTL